MDTETVHFVNYEPADDTYCEYCGLFREQPGGVIEPGERNDAGWWCEKCVADGYKQTVAEQDWELFAEDYPDYAAELAELRKRVGDV